MGEQESGTGCESGPVERHDPGHLVHPPLLAAPADPIGAGTIVSRDCIIVKKHTLHLPFLRVL